MSIVPVEAFLLFGTWAWDFGCVGYEHWGRWSQWKAPLLSVAVWKKAPLYWCSTMSLWGDHFQGCTSSFSDGSTSSAVEQYYLLTCPFSTYFHSLNKENTFILLINLSILTQRKVKISIILLEKKLVKINQSWIRK